MEFFKGNDEERNFIIKGISESFCKDSDQFEKIGESDKLTNSNAYKIFVFLRYFSKKIASYLVFLFYIPLLSSIFLSLIYFGTITIGHGSIILLILFFIEFLLVVKLSIFVSSFWHKDHYDFVREFNKTCREAFRFPYRNYYNP